MGKGRGVMWVRTMNSREMKQSEAPESRRMRRLVEPMKRGRMNESLLGTAARVAVYGIGQFSSCNEYIEELPFRFPKLQ